jgi:hypothetical protein
MKQQKQQQKGKPMIKWQPFETVPTDGTNFLAYWEDEDKPDDLKYVICCYRYGLLWPQSIKEYDLPTHWTSLPKPPK